ncbi:MAG: inositol monophosphatase family protein [Promethearchaeota archaeon]
MSGFRWLQFLIETAKEVRRAVRPLIGTAAGRREVGPGAGGDVTLELDRVAEELVESRLRSLSRPVVLVSEELGVEYLGGATEDTETRVVVDPVDGSYNAARGIPFSCVSLAQASGRTFADVEVGVVLNLSTGDLYTAQKGRGASRNGEPVTASALDAERGCVVTSASKTPEFYQFYEKYAPVINPFRKKRSLGSMALSTCLVASGACEMYVNDRNIVRSVDVAAAYLILREAGGVALTRDGSDFGGELSLYSGTSYVATNRVVAERVRKLFREIEAKDYKGDT